MITHAFLVSSGFAFAWLLTSSTTRAQTLEKRADFGNVIVGGTYASGSSNPYDNSIQIGNDLWFTTQNGGANDRGTVSYYNLTTRMITAVVSLDNATGNTPQSSLTQVGDQLYFTTTRGGTGDTGTVSRFNYTVANPTVTPVVNFGSTATATNPRTPVGGLTSIDRGANGTDLYFTTSNGGTGGAAFGTISKYNTLSGTTSVVHNFTGAGTANGRQPMEGFTNVGGKLYFTTFTGGANAGTGFPNGTGTVSVLDPANDTVSTLASLPSGGAQFPAHNPTATPNGMLYFTTTGNATQPGSLQQYNLTTGTLSTLYALTGAPTASGPFPDGRFAYGSVLALNNVLYFTTIQGGAFNRGTIDAFDLGSNTFTKLFDLDGGTAATDGPLKLGQEPRGGFTLVNEDGADYLYLLTRAGGVNGTNGGTVLRMTPIVPVPEPGVTGLLLMAGAVGGGWGWRRHRGRWISGADAPDRTLVPSSRPVRGGMRRAGFSLIELLVVVTIIGVLTGIALPATRNAKDRGREVTCMGNLRQIGAAYYCYAQDHDGYFPSTEAIGDSNYRQSDDPLGLPVLFIPYVGKDSKIWLCPAGRPSLNAYGVNYAWSRSDNVTAKPVLAMERGTTNALAWDNFTMTLPSIKNVPEPTGGPRAASVQYRYYAHRASKQVNYLYADGHVGTQ